MAVAVALNWAVLLSTLSADEETGSKDRQRHEALPNSTILGGRHWISENLEISHANTKIDSIVTALFERYPDAEKDMSKTLIVKIIHAVFPNAVKSKILEKDSHTSEFKSRLSFKGLNLNTKVKHGTPVPFERLADLVPTDWFLISKTDNVIVLGKFSDERFNGNPVTYKIQMMNTGECSMYIGDRNIDLQQFYISPCIKFNAGSVSAFFRCITNTLRLCCGHKIGSRNIMNTSVTMKERYTDAKQKFKTSVVRHVNCDRIVSVQALVRSCRKCSTLIYRISRSRIIHS